MYKTLKVHKHLEKARYDEDAVIAMNTFSIKRIYLQLRGDILKAEWRKLVWSNYGTPKLLFILYQPVNRRLTTKTRLEK